MILENNLPLSTFPHDRILFLMLMDLKSVCNSYWLLGLLKFLLKNSLREPQLQEE